jgi:hypothetical protein
MMALDTSFDQYLTKIRDEDGDVLPIRARRWNGHTYCNHISSHNDEHDFPSRTSLCSAGFPRSGELLLLTTPSQPFDV